MYRSCFAALAFAGASPGAEPDAALEVLEIRCLECHTVAKKEGGLAMESLDGMLAGGDSGAALKPGDAAGAPWPESRILVPELATSLPGWDAPPDPRIVGIEVFPKSVNLETAADFHRVIVIARLADASTHDITRQAKLLLGDSSLAVLDANALTPKKDGATSLRVEYRGLSAEVPVTVKDATKPRPVSFQLDVMPVLTAAGCNTGSCHGSARGQDGFHPTLFGYDPKGDHFRLTHEMAGRRINLALPEESLLVTKAAGAVPHTGGKLIETDDPFHRTLVAWIRDGARFDEGEVAGPASIEVRPEEMLLGGPGIGMPLSVRAVYADGTDRDVTTLSTFFTSNDHSVSIDSRAGFAKSNRRGEALLLARFQTFTEGARVIVVPKDETYVRPEFPPLNYIDTQVAEKPHKLRIVPSDLAEDEVFLRRVHLDMVGVPATVEERGRFLADTRPDKRALLVDQLLERREFSEMWVMKWAELMRIRTFDSGGQQVSYKVALDYYQWLRERISGNMPSNKVVRELLSAKGGTFSNPATNYFQTEQEIPKLTENVAQVFMGTRIQCAQCHNHPFDRWTMGDYYGFAAFFAQVKRKQAEDPRERVVYDDGGEIQHPVTKRNMTPKFLGGPKPDLTATSRREAVADWLTSPENPWFARNVANIVWAHFFGSGIVEPVDDVRISNPPSNPELLDALAAKFVAHDHDIRKLVRDICTSRTYQLFTRTNAANSEDTRDFSHAAIRRVRAEVLLDRISRVTATPNKFKGLPPGARAVQIADGSTTNYFLTTFGRATRTTVCSCEVKMEPNLSQALHLLNGDTTHQRIRQGRIVETLVAAKTPAAGILEHLYLTTLGRAPTDRERAKLMASLDGKSEPAALRETLEDIFWALLNSKEFIFNH